MQLRLLHQTYTGLCETFNQQAALSSTTSTKKHNQFHPSVFPVAVAYLIEDSARMGRLDLASTIMGQYLADFAPHAQEEPGSSQEGIEPTELFSVAPFNALIKLYCKAGEIEKAQMVFEEMLRLGVTPTHATYASLIHAYGFDDSESILHLLDLMMHSESGTKPTIRPSLAVLNKALLACLNSTDAEKKAYASSLFELILERYGVREYGVVSVNADEDESSPLGTSSPQPEKQTVVVAVHPPATTAAVLLSAVRTAKDFELLFKDIQKWRVAGSALVQKHLFQACSRVVSHESSSQKLPEYDETPALDLSHRLSYQLDVAERLRKMNVPLAYDAREILLETYLRAGAVSGAINFVKTLDVPAVSSPLESRVNNPDAHAHAHAPVRFRTLVSILKSIKPPPTEDQQLQEDSSSSSTTTPLAKPVHSDSELVWHIWTSLQRWKKPVQPHLFTAVVEAFGRVGDLRGVWYLYELLMSQKTDWEGRRGRVSVTKASLRDVNANSVAAKIPFWKRGGVTGHYQGLDDPNSVSLTDMVRASSRPSSKIPEWNGTVVDIPTTTTTTTTTTPTTSTTPSTFAAQNLVAHLDPTSPYLHAAFIRALGTGLVPNIDAAIQIAESHVDDVAISSSSPTPPQKRVLPLVGATLSCMRTESDVGRYLDRIVQMIVRGLVVSNGQHRPHVDFDVEVFARMIAETVVRCKYPTNVDQERMMKRLTLMYVKELKEIEGMMTEQGGVLGALGKLEVWTQQVRRNGGARIETRT
ncbi:hypothetical protein HK102_010150 [Quaeritorhiza haematococci]|nr:hypothetical protein HK102_010150 [Quaeritorhiza haematococci]